MLLKLGVELGIYNMETVLKSNSLPILPSITEDMSSPPHTSSQGKEIQKITKLFWRFRLNVDIFFYMHEANQCLELIIYDADKNNEIQRIRLNNAEINKVIESEVMEKAETVYKDSIRKDKFAKSTAIPKSIIDKENLKIKIKYIMDRLLASANTENPSSPVLFSLSPLAGDTIDFARFEMTTEESTPSATVRRRRKQT